MSFNQDTPANRILTSAVVAADVAALNTALNTEYDTINGLVNPFLVGAPIFGVSGTDLVAYVTYWSYNAGNVVTKDDNNKPNTIENLAVTAASPAALATALTTTWATLLNTKTNFSLLQDNPLTFGLDGSDYYVFINYQYYSAV